MTRAMTALVALAICAPLSWAEEAPKAPQDAAQSATERACYWPANGAVENEPLEARIRRLETALRLSRAERAVNTQAARRRK